MYYSGLQNKQDLISVKSSGITIMPIGMVQWIVSVKGTGLKRVKWDTKVVNETNFPSNSAKTFWSMPYVFVEVGSQNQKGCRKVITFWIFVFKLKLVSSSNSIYQTFVY